MNDSDAFIEIEGFMNGGSCASDDESLMIEKLTWNSKVLPENLPIFADSVGLSCKVHSMHLRPKSKITWFQMKRCSAAGSRTKRLVTATRSCIAESTTFGPESSPPSPAILRFSKSLRQISGDHETKAANTYCWYWQVGPGTSIAAIVRHGTWIEVPSCHKSSSWQGFSDSESCGNRFAQSISGCCWHDHWQPTRRGGNLVWIISGDAVIDNARAARAQASESAGPDGPDVLSVGPPATPASGLAREQGLPLLASAWRRLRVTVTILSGAGY